MPYPFEDKNAIASEKKSRCHLLRYQQQTGRVIAARLTNTVEADEADKLIM